MHVRKNFDYKDSGHSHAFSPCGWKVEFQAETLGQTHFIIT